MAGRRRYYHVTVHHRGFHFRGRIAAPQSALDRIREDVKRAYLGTTLGQGDCEGMKCFIYEDSGPTPLWSNARRIWVDYPCLDLLPAGFTPWRLGR